MDQLAVQQQCRRLRALDKHRRLSTPLLLLLLLLLLLP
jgi:hypothetical protein